MALTFYALFASGQGIGERLSLVFYYILLSAAQALVAYILYYVFRLPGALFRTFAHIERNTRNQL